MGADPSRPAGGLDGARGDHGAALADGPALFQRFGLARIGHGRDRRPCGHALRQHHRRGGLRRLDRRDGGQDRRSVRSRSRRDDRGGAGGDAGA
ncbi:hypothetical protein DR046_08870 [Jannaschia formosa]|nr:hypothetical protein DR046_08870 [Jannaschia formosa]